MHEAEDLTWKLGIFLTSHDEGDDLQRTSFNVHILKDFSIFYLLSMCTLYFPIYLLVATSYQEKRRGKKKEKAPPLEPELEMELAPTLITQVNKNQVSKNNQRTFIDVCIPQGILGQIDVLTP